MGSTGFNIGPIACDIAGILLSIMMLLNLSKRIHYKGSQLRRIRILVILVGIYCLIEAIETAFNGIPGSDIHVMLVLLCSIEYLINLIMLYFWNKVIATHMGIKVSKMLNLIYAVPVIVGGITLIINVFNPIVFTYNNNLYEVASGSIAFGLMGIVYIAIAVCQYMWARKKGGTIKYFPVWHYAIPFLAGSILEPAFDYNFIGITSVIGISAVINNLQNEQIYRDSLTGLFNRAYLEEVKRKISNRPNQFVSGIMLDLDKFKGINDTYGHAEGDDALVISSTILKNSVGKYGDVIRYAGDEFLVFIYSCDEELVEECMNKISNGFISFNDSGEKPYKLSASMGHAIFDSKKQSVNEFLNIIDKNMYENKQR